MEHIIASLFTINFRPGYHPQVPGDHKGGKDKRSVAHVKKPLNAFMLYMKEMRPKIAAECTLKESAAINQILGKRVCAVYLSVFGKLTDFRSDSKYLRIVRFGFLRSSFAWRILEIFTIIMRNISLS